MTTKTTVDQLVKSISFEVEATPNEDATIKLNDSSNSLTPVNVKVRVRKKDKAVVSPGSIAIPQPDGKPELLRLASSEQTILSFNILMEETEYEQKQYRKSKKGLFGMCLSTQNEDDDSQYLPASRAKGGDSRSDSGMLKNKRIVVPKQVADPNAPLKNKDNTIFGKCKPGGCLDPPFGEDRYAYQPTPLRKNAPAPITGELDSIENEVVETDKETTIINKEIPSSSSDKSQNRQDVLKSSIPSLYHEEPNPTLEEKDSDSIITYPPTLSSSGTLYDEERNGKNRKFSGSRRSGQSFNEFNTVYYSPPNKTPRESNENKRSNVAPHDTADNKNAKRMSQTNLTPILLPTDAISVNKSQQNEETNIPQEEEYLEPKKVLRATPEGDNAIEISQPNLIPIVHPTGELSVIESKQTEGISVPETEQYLDPNEVLHTIPIENDKMEISPSNLTSTILSMDDISVNKLHQNEINNPQQDQYFYPSKALGRTPQDNDTIEIIQPDVIPIDLPTDKVSVHKSDSCETTDVPQKIEYFDQNLTALPTTPQCNDIIDHDKFVTHDELAEVLDGYITKRNHYQTEDNQQNEEDFENIKAPPFSSIKNSPLEESKQAQEFIPKLEESPKLIGEIAKLDEKDQVVFSPSNREQLLAKEIKLDSDFKLPDQSFKNDESPKEILETEEIQEKGKQKPTVTEIDKELSFLPINLEEQSGEIRKNISGNNKTTNSSIITKSVENLEPRPEVETSHLGDQLITSSNQNSKELSEDSEKEVSSRSADQKPVFTKLSATKFQPSSVAELLKNKDDEVRLPLSVQSSKQSRPITEDSIQSPISKIQSKSEKPYDEILSTARILKSKDTELLTSLDQKSVQSIQSASNSIQTITNKQKISLGVISDELLPADKQSIYTKTSEKESKPSPEKDFLTETNKSIPSSSQHSLRSKTNAGDAMNSLLNKKQSLSDNPDDKLLPDEHTAMKPIAKESMPISEVELTDKGNKIMLSPDQLSVQSRLSARSATTKRESLETSSKTIDNNFTTDQAFIHEKISAKENIFEDKNNDKALSSSDQKSIKSRPSDSLKSPTSKRQSLSGIITHKLPVELKSSFEEKIFQDEDNDKALSSSDRKSIKSRPSDSLKSPTSKRKSLSGIITHKLSVELKSSFEEKICQDEDKDKTISSLDRKSVKSKPSDSLKSATSKRQSLSGIITHELPIELKSTFEEKIFQTEDKDKTIPSSDQKSIRSRQSDSLKNLSSKRQSFTGITADELPVDQSYQKLRTEEFDQSINLEVYKEEKNYDLLTSLEQKSHHSKTSSDNSIQTPKIHELTTSSKTDTDISSIPKLSESLYQTTDAIATPRKLSIDSTRILKDCSSVERTPSLQSLNRKDLKPISPTSTKRSMTSFKDEIEQLDDETQNMEDNVKIIETAKSQLQSEITQIRLSQESDQDSRRVLSSGESVHSPTLREDRLSSGTPVTKSEFENQIEYEIKIHPLEDEQVGRTDDITFGIEKSEISERSVTSEKENLSLKADKNPAHSQLDAFEQKSLTRSPITEIDIPPIDIVNQVSQKLERLSKGVSDKEEKSIKIDSQLKRKTDSKSSKESATRVILEPKESVPDKTTSKTDQMFLGKLSNMNPNTSRKGTSQILLDLAFQTHSDGGQTLVKTLDSTDVDPNRANVVIVKSMFRSSDGGISVPIRDGHFMNITIKPPSSSKAEPSVKAPKSIMKADSGKSSTDYEGTSGISFKGKGLQSTFSSIYNQDLVPLQQVIEGLKHDIDALASKQLIIGEVIGAKKLRQIRTMHNFNTRKCSCYRK